MSPESWVMPPDSGVIGTNFEATEELYSWTYDELRAIVGK